MFKNIYYISKESQDKITLWMNHLLVVFAFLMPIHGKAKSSVFFCILILFLYRRNFIYYLKLAFKIELLKYFIFLYLVFVFGMFYTTDISSGMAFMDKAKQLIFPLLFLSFLDTRFSFRVLNAFIFGVLLSELVSYAIHFEIIPPELFIGKYKIYQTTISDPSPFYGHGIHNIFLAIVISILLYRIIVKEIDNIYIKIFSLLFITTAFINMSLIGGRIGYLAIFILVFLVLILSYKKQIKKIIFISSLLILAMIVYLYNFSNQFEKRLGDTKSDIENIIKNDNYNSSIGLRIITSKYSLEVLKENPLLGVGTGDAMNEIYKLAENKHHYIKTYMPHPHNLYLQVLMQVGILGFSILALMFYKILTYNKIEKKRKDIIVIITSAFLIYVFTASLWTYLSVLITIICAMISTHKFDIGIKEIDKISILNYILVIIIFLIIGITK
ncbi:O-antigen ligase family protein [Aliarcobacter cryaerophilus]|uniref:O-antigen ligase family protein n=1 Tax=Aliarcobacter cryaerophilus TaxID=28198 RepID=UPI0021B19F44|nr:O-antigen ligase family protein [Aliarcobacter cryaerophilus]MCT7544013.1 O-antigen ligase family protein [Aliarcobacter cryaerophilus]